MRDAIGGALTLQIIMVFMLVVNAYLAYSVSYTKAFRAKNEIINIIENNEGYPNQDAINGCDASNPSGALCQIKTYLDKIGYQATNFPQNDAGCNGAKGQAYGYCIIPHKKDVTGNSNPQTGYLGVYYTVYTYVNISIPIIDKFFSNVIPQVFRISGETNTIYSSGTNNNIFTTIGYR